MGHAALMKPAGQDTGSDARNRTASAFKQALRLWLGKWVVRFQGYGAQYQAEQRKQFLSRVCTADATANISETAGFANPTGDPSRITIGANSCVMSDMILFPQGGKISVGQRSFIGPNSKVWSAASVTIGNYVLVAHGVSIFDNVSHSVNWRERREEIDQILPHMRLVAHQFDLKAGPLIIEDDVWIGFGASIIGSVRIGRGAIIGAGTMVTKDVEPFSLVVGNPMRVVKTLGPENKHHVA